MKPDCGTKAPLLAYTCYFNTNLVSHFEMCTCVSRDKKIANITSRLSENEETQKTYSAALQSPLLYYI